MKKKIVFFISCFILLLGLITAIPSLYNAVTSHGIIQVIGSLFGGDLVMYDGFVWSRGGFEGTVYMFAAFNAIGIIAGLLLTIVGGIGVIKCRKKQKILPIISHHSSQ